MRDDLYLGLAEQVARDSLCDARQVGAVLVDDSGPLVSACNRPAVPPADGSRCSSWCARRQANDRSEGYGSCPAVHAEDGALERLGRLSRLTRGPLSLYVTHAPCEGCASKILMSPVKAVIWTHQVGPDIPEEWAAQSFRALRKFSRVGLAVRVQTRFVTDHVLPTPG